MPMTRTSRSLDRDARTVHSAPEKPENSALSVIAGGTESATCMDAAEREREIEIAQEEP